MTLLREVIGDVLRDARTEQGRTLREVSHAARVSLGYLSEVERGCKEASSELLGAICGALEMPLSHMLVVAGERLADTEAPHDAAPGAHATASEPAVAVPARHTATRPAGPRIDPATRMVIGPVASLAVA